ncbi:MAG: hypothetical protein M3P18_08620, partial [Actinomycetota bacterium]|nr:hypothetical protein [Actinomycetota bacterium]
VGVQWRFAQAGIAGYLASRALNGRGRRREPGGACGVKALEMSKIPVFVIATLALAATVASASSPKVTSIRLVSDGGFAPHHSVTVVDMRNRVALARAAARLPATLPRLQPVEGGCMDCVLNTLTIMRGARRSSLSWYNGPPRSLRSLLAALAKYGRHSGDHP